MTRSRRAFVAVVVGQTPVWNGSNTSVVGNRDIVRTPPSRGSGSAFNSPSPSPSPPPITRDDTNNNNIKNNNNNDAESQIFTGGRYAFTQAAQPTDAQRGALEMSRVHLLERKKVHSSTVFVFLKPKISIFLTRRNLKISGCNWRRNRMRLATNTQRAPSQRSRSAKSGFKTCASAYELLVDVVKCVCVLLLTGRVFKLCTAEQVEQSRRQQDTRSGFARLHCLTGAGHLHSDTERYACGRDSAGASSDMICVVFSYFCVSHHITPSFVLQLITGRGKHSAGGVGRIKIALEERMQTLTDQYYHTVHLGFLTVTKRK